MVIFDGSPKENLNILIIDSISRIKAHQDGPATGSVAVWIPEATSGIIPILI